MEAETSDQLMKSLSLQGSTFSGTELGHGNVLISPVTLQMQKHLLSSTLQTTSEPFRARSGRNGSFSPTPALSYTPTPSSSPFNSLSLSINSSLSDLNLSLATDTKTLNFLHDHKNNLYPTSSASFDDIDLCDRNRIPGGKYTDLSISHIPLSVVSSTDIASGPQFSAQMELNSVLSFSSEQNQVHLPVSSQQDNINGYLVMDEHGGTSVSSSISILAPTAASILDNNIRLLEMSDASKTVKIVPVSMTSQLSSPMDILPKQDNCIRLQPCITTLKPVCSQQITCLTAIPTVTTQQITCITNLPTPVTTQIACLSAVPRLSTIETLNCLPSTSSTGDILAGSFQTFNSTIMHPNKKRRLLTFLTEDSNVGTQVNQSQPSKSDTYILSSSCPSLVAVSSNSSTLIIDHSPTINSVSKAETTLFLNPTGTSLITETKPISSTIFISEGSPSLQGEKPTNPSLFFNQRETIGKTEQTLIINSDGTQATLYTPVSTAQTTLIASQSETGTILAPVSGDILEENQLIQPGGVQNYLAKSSYSTGPVLSAPTISFRPILSTSFTVESITGSVQDNLGMESLSVQFPLRNGEERRPVSSIENLIEMMTVYKCKLCGFLSTTADGVEIHIFDDHDDEISNFKYEDDNNWVKVAVKKGIKLNCPMCANLFSSERSFIVHLTDDHMLTEAAAVANFNRENAERKTKIFKIIREEKEKLKEERRRSKQFGYEAYVDSLGELRIRSSGLGVQSPRSTDENSEDEVDVEGEDLRIRVTGGEKFDMKASDYVDMVLKGRAVATGTKDKAPHNLKNKVVRIKVGRPKGSRTLGLSWVKKVNPNLALSDQLMGEECGVDNCAVRLKNPSKLELHRYSHLDEGYQCTECMETFPTWAKCALHLWRQHNQDMELYRCEACDYRSFTLTVLEKHRSCHLEEKPFLCPDCGRALKNEKHLRDHMKNIHRVGLDGDMVADDNSVYECDICHQRMSSQREVRYHKERVHDRKKPWLCIHCGYAAFSNSSLKLHMRSHTGDKPYFCKECKYRTSDHNSLRRHSLRHSGQKPYQCPHCPYAAIQSSTYKIHLKRKHPDKSGEMFECQECSFATVQEKLFLGHLAGHRGNNSNKDRGEEDGENAQPDTTVWINSTKQSFS